MTSETRYRDPDCNLGAQGNGVKEPGCGVGGARTSTENSHGDPEGNHLSFAEAGKKVSKLCTSVFRS